MMEPWVHNALKSKNDDDIKNTSSFSSAFEELSLLLHVFCMLDERTGNIAI